MQWKLHVRFGKGFLNKLIFILLFIRGLIFYFTMIIAVPTGIKIFSWLTISFSKIIKLIKKYIYNIYININYNNNNLLLPEINTKSLIEIYNKSNTRYIEEDNKTKTLVRYGSNIITSIGIKRPTSIVRSMYSIPNNILYILIGVILTDGTIAYSSKKNLDKSIFNKGKPYENGIYTKHNCRFKFKQSIKNIEYTLYLYNKLSHYCISPPFIKKARLNGKEFKQIEFVTMALPCFSILRHMFYDGRIKIIPNIIYDYINYESIAHMIMCDGSFNSNGLVLNLQSFTLKELTLLLNILKIKFNLDCSIHKSRNKYILYLKVHSVKILYPHIYKFIVPSMRYKFNKVLTNYYI